MDEAIEETAIKDTETPKGRNGFSPIKCSGMPLFYCRLKAIFFWMLAEKVNFYNTNNQHQNISGYDSIEQRRFFNHSYIDSFIGLDC